jgi:hypothetical protein
MRPKFSRGGLHKVRAWEYAVRFVFGGAVTVAAGLVARAYGPFAGGLFLGFPAVLPATLTLVNQHDGRKKAMDDARGARLGSAGMVVFAIVVWRGATRASPAVVLVLATVAWAVVDLALWFVRYGREPQPPPGK